MLALGVASHVAVDDVLSRLSGDGGALVGGIAHSRGAELGEPRVDLGPELWRRDEPSDAHPVRPLPAAPGEPTPSVAFFIAEFAVRIQLQRQPVGDLRQLVGAQFESFLGEELFGVLHCGWG